MPKFRNVNIPIPQGEVSEWVKNAARNFGITEHQFLMICLQDAWEKLYNKTFTWKEFTLIERKNLEKLESHQCPNDNTKGVNPGECGIHCVKR